MIEYPEPVRMIEGLPRTAQEELAEFLNYLQYRYRLDQYGQIVKLGGLWADIDLDVTDEDIRALRQQVTRPLAGKV